MSETNKTYRIKANIGTENDVINIDTSLLQDYNTLDILSVKISSVDTYKLHNSNYGVVVGRVLANNGFGVPNAKISIFIEMETSEGEKVRELYPFASVNNTNSKGIRYNLLPDEKVNDCHQAVGTFPNKRYMLDNDIVLEVFDKYYKYTTRTNNSGDYLLMGVPVGTYVLHMDLDLSDCGILSQKPRDFVYKGYTIEQFESPTSFKVDTEYSNLSQIFTQNQTVTVRPFWGNESIGEQIGITRADINIAFKFETTCVFLGSVISDSVSNGISRKCIATENMGNMEELTTGEGTIEMIRKTPSGEVEEIKIKGTQLINANGVWCYQIPMNLDYMMTDEYGNMVPTDDPSKGIPTRTCVRFRISMQDNDESTDNFYRAKMLVPHNPSYKDDKTHEGYDYEFGSLTKDESFRDLFMDNVYSVKSYIPRFQKKKVKGWNTKNFTGIKSCNFHGNNNPIPYNNIRIRLPLMFTILCGLIKCFIFLTGIFNAILSYLGEFLMWFGGIKIFGWRPFKSAYNTATNLTLNVLSEGLCPDIENWYFAPIKRQPEVKGNYDIVKQTLAHLMEDNGYNDKTSIEYSNSESEDEVMCVTTKIDYLISCMELNLAMEYKVINFDFYNDWINGMIYIPRFMYYIRKKKTFLGITFASAKVRSCMDNTRIFSKTRNYTQQCSIAYLKNNKDGYTTYNKAYNVLKSEKDIKKANNFHKKTGFSQVTVFGKRGGICHEHSTLKKQKVYYMKPCEWQEKGKVLLYATDIILLGSLKGCNNEGIPQAFRYLSSTSYVMPTNLALTNMETHGHLYVNNKNTVCAGKSNQMDINANSDDSIRIFNPNDGLAAELEVYSGSGDRNIDTQYEGNELSDLVPLTEAAGIAWNYTGPGQGEINEKDLYFPGGHFLGLTCNNSQTNIKSCINLSRICELGVNMSQRREEIVSVSGESVTFANSAPTGFIGREEIVGDKFRTMFATLNQKRLCATKFNTETGYYIYDFDFVNPLNFNGAFYDVVTNSKSYNNEIKNDSLNDDIKRLSKFGINTNLDERMDGEGTINIDTQTKTNEDISLEYYRFRFGLDYKNLTQRDNVHRNHFSLEAYNKYYLPQYENSFYFYFGLKQGATAIDEFNKQFYATCETTKLSLGTPSLDVYVSDLEVCKGKAEVTISLDNVEMPLKEFYYVQEIGPESKIVSLIDNKTKYISEVEGLDFGKYTINATDSNGTYLSKTIDLGSNVFTYNIETFDFNVYDSSEWLNDSGERNETDKNMYVGGYLEISNVNVIDEFKYVFENNIQTHILVKYLIEQKNEETKEVEKIEKTLSSTTFSIVNENNEESKNDIIRIFVPQANESNTTAQIPYHVYLVYSGATCENGTNSDTGTTKVYLTTCYFKDGKNVQLKMGLPEVNYYLTVGSHSGDDEATITIPNVKKDEKTNKVAISGETKELGKESNFYFGSSKWYEELDNNLNAETMEEWLQKMCLFKNTNKLHSNNVYTDNDLKVLWGIPQNKDGYDKTVSCSENISDITDGFSLDDDASYFKTKPEYPYSSLAVNNTVVSGDFYGKLENGNFVTEELKGEVPIINTGYIFKPLPSGDLEYYVYSDSISAHTEGTTNGVFYSSFAYPVYSKPFNVDAKFFIWGDRYVHMAENDDALPELKYEELAGRTELRITNGLRFKGKFGAEGKNIEISNIPSNFFEEESFYDNTDEVFITGITVSGYRENEETGVEEFYEESAINSKNPKVLKGFAGHTSFSCNISEGYPDIEGDIPIEERKYYLQPYVQNITSSIDVVNNFYDYATYEYLEGVGFEVTLRKYSDKQVRRYLPKNIKRNEIGTWESAMVCLQHPNNVGGQLLVIPEGNDKYIYIRLGDKDYPTYYVLCSYTDDEKKHSNRPGELCFIKLSYYHKDKCRCTWAYNSPTVDSDTDNDDNEGGTKKTIEVVLKNVKEIKNDLIYIFKHSTLTKEMNGYITPVLNRKLNANIDNWEETILRDNSQYQKDYNTDYTNKGEYYYYFVEKRESTQNNNKMTLYKIYPTFLKEDDFEDDDIKLSNYRLVYELERKFNFGEKDFVTYKIKNDNRTPKDIRIEYKLQTSIKEAENAIKEAENAINYSLENGAGVDIDRREGQLMKLLTSGNSLSIFNTTTGETSTDTISLCSIYIDKAPSSESAETYSDFETKYPSSYYNSATTTSYITHQLLVKINNNANFPGDGFVEVINFNLSNDTIKGENLIIEVLPYKNYIYFLDTDFNGLKSDKLIFENSGGTIEFYICVNYEDYISGVFSYIPKIDFIALNEGDEPEVFDINYSVGKLTWDDKHSIYKTKCIVNVNQGSLNKYYINMRIYFDEFMHDKYSEVLQLLVNETETVGIIVSPKKLVCFYQEGDLSKPKELLGWYKKYGNILQASFHSTIKNEKFTLSVENGNNEMVPFAIYYKKPIEFTGPMVSFNELNSDIEITNEFKELNSNIEIINGCELLLIPTSTTNINSGLTFNFKSTNTEDTTNSGYTTDIHCDYSPLLQFNVEQRGNFYFKVHSLYNKNNYIESGGTFIPSYDDFHETEKQTGIPLESKSVGNGLIDDGFTGGYDSVTIFNDVLGFNVVISATSENRLNGLYYVSWDENRYNKNSELIVPPQDKELIVRPIEKQIDIAINDWLNNGAIVKNLTIGKIGAGDNFDIIAILNVEFLIKKPSWNVYLNEYPLKINDTSGKKIPLHKLNDNRVTIKFESKDTTSLPNGFYINDSKYTFENYNPFDEIREGTFDISDFITKDGIIQINIKKGQWYELLEVQPGDGTLKPPINFNPISNDE